MNRAVFIIPYFGKCPAYYDIWLYTAKKNKSFDFMFFTDIDYIKSGGNIKVINISFNKLKEIFQSKFDFRISLNSPYKLCDYKPAYGDLLCEYIREYEFWGHCDIDTILGDLKHFVTDDILDNYDKIFEHGHLTLYRNNDVVNNLYRSMGDYPEYSYKYVFTTDESCYFDEFYGMMLKCRRLKVNTYINNAVIFDVNANKYKFVNAINKGNQHEHIFEYSSGKLYARYVDDKHNLITYEVAYAHFQKRNMQYNCVETAKDGHFYIIPNSAVDANNIDAFKNETLKTKLYEFNVKINHIKDFLKRYGMVKNEYKSIIDYYKSRQKFKQRRKAINKLLEKLG